MPTCLWRSNSTGVIGLALRYSGSTRFQAPSKSPQRIAADQAYCASCSLSSLLPMLAQPAANSTTAMASQQCFIIRIALLLPGSGVAARVATPRSSVLARDRDVACAAGGRYAAVGQRYRSHQGGACAPAFAQGGDETLPRFALCGMGRA